MNLPKFIADGLASSRKKATGTENIECAVSWLPLGECDSTANRFAPFKLTSKFESRVVVFCGSHGVAHHNVSALPEDFVLRTIEKMAFGTSPGSRLSRLFGIPFTPIMWPATERTKDFSKNAALSVGQCEADLLIGWKSVEVCKESVIGFGELGVGNTTSASALLCSLLNLSPSDVVGSGSGIDSRQRQVKLAIVKKALAVHRSSIHSPLDALRLLGGHEIAGIVGGILRCVIEGRVVVLDGLVTTVAALIASLIEPCATSNMLCCCSSSEKVHKIACVRLGLRPFISLNQSCGEGVGAYISIMHLRASIALSDTGRINVSAEQVFQNS